MTTLNFTILLLPLSSFNNNITWRYVGVIGLLLKRSVLKELINSFLERDYGARGVTL